MTFNLLVHMGSRWGTVTYMSAQWGELLFIMVLLDRALQKHPTDQFPPQGVEQIFNWTFEQITQIIADRHTDKVKKITII